MIVSDADYENNVYVHKIDAEMRAECVSSVSYNVTLCLPKGMFFYFMLRINIGENYLGKVTVHLTLSKVPHKQLFLDFRGVSIGNLTVNGTQVKEEGISSFRNHKVYLPTNILKIGGEDNIVSLVISG